MAVRKGLLALLIGSLLVLPLQSVLATTPKTGTSCTRLNQVQIVGKYKFTCVKSGKKLVWNKRILTSKPFPSPTKIPNLNSLDTASGLLAQYYSDYFAFKPKWFETAKSVKTFASDQKIEYLSQSREVNFSIQWIGYFTPNLSGKWNFQLETSDRSTNLWIGQKAVSDYTSDNSLVIVKAKPTPITARFSLSLKSGISYPVRLQFGSAGNNGFIKLKVTSPDMTEYEDLSSLTKYFKNSQDKPLGFSNEFNLVNQSQFEIAELAEGQISEYLNNDPWQNLAKHIFNDAKLSQSNTINSDLIISPNVSTDTSMKLSQILTYVLSFWSSKGVTFPEPFNIIVFSEKDRDWFKSQLPAENDIYNCSASYWFTDYWSTSFDNGQCKLSNGKYIFAEMIGTRFDPSKYIHDMKYGVSHEIIHSVQTFLMNTSFGELQNKQPCWFVEGMPSMMGYYLLNSVENDQNQLKIDRQSSLQEFLDNAQTRNFTKGEKALSDWSLDEWLTLSISTPAFGETCRAKIDLDGSTVGAPVLFGYEIGFLITEKFILQFGLDNLLQLLRYNQTSPNFADAFIRATGLDMNIWLKDYGIKYALQQCGSKCSNYVALKQ
jgi:hypothetical protein